MLVPVQMPFQVPPGIGIETVDDGDPTLMRCPLVIESSSSMASVIYRKFWDYRMWHKRAEIDAIPEVMPPDNSGRIIDAIQDLYRFNEVDHTFASGVNSVTLLYPKAIEPRVTMQLSACPPRLPILAGDSLEGVGRSIHVQGSAGTKSLAVFQRSLDIDVADRGVLVYLNNPADPSWVAVVPRGRPAMLVYMRQQVLNEKEMSEGAAWERVESCLNSGGKKAHGKPYPNGENSFPDYRAWISDEEFDVEMTTVPDMKKWTIKSHYRDLEKRISEVAQEPGETRQDVIQDLKRVLAKKRNSVEKERLRGNRRPCMLVISNWSTYELSGDGFWTSEDLSAFQVIMLNESDKTYLVHP